MYLRDGFAKTSFRHEIEVDQTVISLSNSALKQTDKDSFARHAPFVDAGLTENSSGLPWFSDSVLHYKQQRPSMVL